MKTAPEIARESGHLLSRVRAAALLSGAKHAGMIDSEFRYPAPEARKIVAALADAAPPRPKPSKAGPRAESLGQVQAQLEVIASSLTADRVSFPTLHALYREKHGEEPDDVLADIQDAERENPWPMRQVERAGGVQNALSKCVAEALRRSGKKIAL